MRRQFIQDFRVRRQAVSQWLRFLQENHLGYRGIAVSWDRVQELPEDDSVLDQVLTQDINVVSQETATDDRAFPALFPRGGVEFVTPRLRHVPYRDYIRHPVKHESDRFARHPRFRFAAFNTTFDPPTTGPGPWGSCASTCPSRARYGFCADGEILPTTRSLTIMNKNAQMELASYTDKHKLPYYDKIEFDEHGWLITQNIVVARNRRGKWPADFNSDGDIYPDRWQVGEPLIAWAHGLHSFRYSPVITPWSASQKHGDLFLQSTVLVPASSLKSTTCEAESPREKHAKLV
ncbi:hypothetical protein N7519_007372 [Penicillium mononematosum]|uniref:uncharacterized protein n=1 Tax=Penicillium mononematosum TaxID=268346 RepID=UPI00254937F2|nr:uncharacterized protein N7519_007372 [Penicillium mononematosum]KAJ6186071.1 hypothetical protein N7519_007372 [Penicillium mononematosum]